MCSLLTPNLKKKKKVRLQRWVKIHLQTNYRHYFHQFSFGFIENKFALYLIKNQHNSFAVSFGCTPAPRAGSMFFSHSSLATFIFSLPKVLQKPAKRSPRFILRSIKLILLSHLFLLVTSLLLRECLSVIHRAKPSPRRTTTPKCISLKGWGGGLICPIAAFRTASQVNTCR